MAENLPTPESERVGATIRTLRELSGLKADQLANKILISRPYLANLEAGRKRLSPEHASRIADALGVPRVCILRPDEYPSEGAA